MPAERDDVSLRDYIERLFVEHQRAHTVEFASTEEARREAQADVQRRLEGLNELRNEVLKDRNQFLRADVYDQRHEVLANRLEVLERQAIKDTELHANIIPDFRTTENTVEEITGRVSKLESAARRAEEAAAKTERNRKWLLGLTVTVVLAILAILANVIVSLIHP